MTADADDVFAMLMADVDPCVHIRWVNDAEPEFLFALLTKWGRSVVAETDGSESPSDTAMSVAELLDVWKPDAGVPMTHVDNWLRVLNKVRMFAYGRGYDEVAAWLGWVLDRTLDEL